MDIDERLLETSDKLAKESNMFVQLAESLNKLMVFLRPSKGEEKKEEKIEKNQ